MALFLGIVVGSFVAILTAWIGDPPDDEEFWSIPVRIIKPRKKR